MGAGLANPTPNTGRLTISLQPRAERDASAAAVIQRLLPSLARIPGLTVYLRPVQDIEMDARSSKTEFQYAISGATTQSVARWASNLLAAMRTLATLRDAATDAQEGGFRTMVQVDRAAAMRFDVSMHTVQSVLNDAFGQRQVSTIFTQDNQYRVVLGASPDGRPDRSRLRNCGCQPRTMSISRSARSLGSNL